MTPTALLVGATGMFGSRIAHHLVNQPDARVRLLVRREQSSGNRAALESILRSGAEIVEGDLASRVSLDRAIQGVDVIVSAAQGGSEVIIDGQVALAEAGRHNGVRRILPSDYALDLFKANKGEHPLFDLRRAADERIADAGIEHVHVLQGAFMEMFRPGAGVIGEDGVVRFWGDGTQPIDTTSVEDTARIVARIALDRDVRSGKFAFAGARISILDAAKTVEIQTGRRLEHRSLGSEADLRVALAEAKDDLQTAIMLAYQLTMLTGQMALGGLQNGRYPDFELERFDQFAARTMPRATAA